MLNRCFDIKIKDKQGHYLFSVKFDPQHRILKFACAGGDNWCEIVLSDGNNPYNFQYLLQDLQEALREIAQGLDQRELARGQRTTPEEVLYGKKLKEPQTCVDQIFAVEDKNIIGQIQSAAGMTPMLPPSSETLNTQTRQIANQKLVLDTDNIQSLLDMSEQHRKDVNDIIRRMLQDGAKTTVERVTLKELQSATYPIAQTIQSLAKRDMDVALDKKLLEALDSSCCENKVMSNMIDEYEDPSERSWRAEDYESFLQLNGAIPITYGCECPVCVAKRPYYRILERLWMKEKKKRTKNLKVEKPKKNKKK